MSNISQFKNIGMLQTNYSFRVYIPSIPIGAGKSMDGMEFSVLTRELGVPGMDRDSTILYHLGGQVTYLHRAKHEGTWSPRVLLDSGFVLYNKLVKWFNAIDNINVFSPKTVAYIELLSLNMDVNKIFRMEGIQPIKIPPLDSLNLDNTEGFIEMEVEFAFDNIDFDEDNLQQNAWRVVTNLG